MVARHVPFRLLVSLLAYLGLAIWLTWPLAASLADKLPCTTPACPFDALAQQTLWNVTFPFSVQGIVPTDLQTLLWKGSVATSVGIPVLVLIAFGATVGAWRGRRGTGSGLGHAWRHAALWAIVGIWISLSPAATWGVRTILVNLDELGGERTTAWRRARDRQPDGLRIVYASPTQLLFEVTLPPPGHSGAPACPPPGDVALTTGRLEDTAGDHLVSRVHR